MKNSEYRIFETHKSPTSFTILCLKNSLPTPLTLRMSNSSENYSMRGGTYFFHFAKVTHTSRIASRRRTDWPEWFWGNKFADRGEFCRGSWGRRASLWIGTSFCHRCPPEILGAHFLKLFLNFFFRDLSTFLRKYFYYFEFRRKKFLKLFLKIYNYELSDVGGGEMKGGEEFVESPPSLVHRVVAQRQTGH